MSLMAEPQEYLDVQELPRRKSVTFQELEGHAWSYDEVGLFAACSTRSFVFCAACDVTIPCSGSCHCVEILR